MPDRMTSAPDKTDAPTPASAAPQGTSSADTTRAGLRGQPFAVQMKRLSAVGDDPAAIQRTAADGVKGGGAQLPYLDAIQRSFGAHDVGDVRAHEGAATRDAASSIGAAAYATGSDVAFGQTPDLHTTAHEAAHVVQQRAGVSLAGGVGQSGDAYERQADAVADRVVQGQSASDLLPGGDGGGAAVQRSAAGTAVQFVDHTWPVADAAQAALMTTATIAAFGPYIWDDVVPRFKLDPTYAAWTIADCVNVAVYDPESKAVAGEKGNKIGLIAARRKAAMKAVFGIGQGVCDAIMAHNNGLTPRAALSVAAEDGAGGGHTAQRHVLGGGLMATAAHVAERAAFHSVGGVAMDLDASGCASVFASAADADAAVAAAVAGELTTNWATHRASLAKGTQIKMTFPTAVPTVAYTKADPPLGTPYTAAEMPQYMNAAWGGDRQLYAGHYAGPGKPTDPHGADVAKPPLTTGGPAAWTNVYVIVDPNAAAPGGWAIYTAYPKP